MVTCLTFFQKMVPSSGIFSSLHLTICFQLISARFLSSGVIMETNKKRKVPLLKLCPSFQTEDEILKVMLRSVYQKIFLFSLSLSLSLSLSTPKNTIVKHLNLLWRVIFWHSLIITSFKSGNIICSQFFAKMIFDFVSKNVAHFKFCSAIFMKIW